MRKKKQIFRNQFPPPLRAFILEEDNKKEETDIEIKKK